MLATPFRSAKALAADLRKKKIGCLELLDLYLQRVEKHNPELNAIIAMDVEGARKRARAADRALGSKQVWGPLHGVPMTIKESYDVVGMPTTWGVPDFKGNLPPRNALAVDRLLGAGVVLFGKTNVPIYLADYQSYNAIYGTTNNPWDLSRSPGGSSGGSAAALAAGLTGIEAGSDIGSSIRNPAHYCGVYGHKPTWGVVPPRGQALPGRLSQTDISVIGPMGRGADDLEIALGVMAGPDEIDAAGYKLTLAAPRQKSLRDFKIAVMLTDPNAEVDVEVQEKIQAVADFLAKKRVKVSDRARPDIDTNEAARAYIHLLRAATSGRGTQEEFDKNVAAGRGLPAGDDSYYARMLRGSTTSHRDWLAANETRHKMRYKWADFFNANPHPRLRIASDAGAGQCSGPVAG
jgi:amidase